MAYDEVKYRSRKQRRGDALAAFLLGVVVLGAYLGLLWFIIWVGSWMQQFR